MTSEFARFCKAGDSLRHLLDDERAAGLLDQEELDWAQLLQDRFYEIYNRRPRRPHEW